MGLEDFKEGEPDISEDTTISELEAVYGREPVRRALSYMTSLSDADEAYRESVSESGYAQDYAEGIVGEKMDEENAEELDDKWAQKSKESGLGVDDE